MELPSSAGDLISSAEGAEDGVAKFRWGLLSLLLKVPRMELPSSDGDLSLLLKVPRMELPSSDGDSYLFC